MPRRGNKDGINCRDSTLGISRLSGVTAMSRSGTSLLDAVQTYQRKKWEQQQALQPLGGRSWGGSLAEYGGIGGLSHLGIHRVKDLPVSRSHRHYQSGLTKQLPPPMRSEPSNLEWDGHNPQSWPGFHAYTSQRPRFEVFPAGDTDQPHTSSAQATPATRMSQPLSESSKSAISSLNRRLYQRTSYSDSFPDYTEELRRSAAARIPTRLKKLGVLPVYERGGTDDADAMYWPVISSKAGSTIPEQVVRRDSRILLSPPPRRKPSKDELREDADADDEIAAISHSPPPNGDRPRSTNKSVSFNETPQVMEDTIKKFSITPNKPMTGVGPNWPPSTSHLINSINGSQLLERNDITQFPPAYRSALKPSAIAEEGEYVPAKERPPTPPVRSDGTKRGKTKDFSGQTEIPSVSPRQRKSTMATSTTIPPIASTGGGGIPAAPPLNPQLFRRNLAAKVNAPLQPLNASQKALAMLSQYDDYDDDIYKELNVPNHMNQSSIKVPSSYRYTMTRRLKPTARGKPVKSAPVNLPALKQSVAKVNSLRTTIDWGAPTTSRSLALPPAPLSDCLTPAGKRVPHRLGLRYKTQAHQRYQSVHPDSVPDLRNSRFGNGGKRYFFYDHHSTVFRG